METLLKRIADRARGLALNHGDSAEVAVTKILDELSDAEELPFERELARNALAVLSGFGPLEPFMNDPAVEELWMNEPNVLFVNKGGRSERLQIDFDAEAQRVVLDRMLRSVGRRIDRSSPFVDAPLQDGSRLHAVIPDVTRMHLSFNIRRFISNKSTLENAVETGVATLGQVGVLKRALLARRTIFVSGATAAGKTTLLCALLDALPSNERIVSVEDTFEISLNKPDWVAMQTRPASAEGAGEIDLRKLIREALRMRPDRLVVGEVRGAEALELLVGLNSGIPSLGTVHANSAEHAMTKLMTLPLLSGASISAEFAKQVLGSTVGLIAHCVLGANGTRRIGELKTVRYVNGDLRFEDAA